MRITKHYLTHDPRGRLLAYRTERLSDDGRGHTVAVNRTIQARCRACSSVVAPEDPAVGICDGCGRGRLCASCVVPCAVCHRRVCRRCRRGFVWGRTPMNTCPRCFERLNRRAIHEQVQQTRQAAFLRAVAVHRERLPAMAMRLQMFRMGPMEPPRRGPRP